MVRINEIQANDLYTVPSILRENQHGQAPWFILANLIGIRVPSAFAFSAGLFLSLSTNKV